jgi:replication factor A1
MHVDPDIPDAHILRGWYDGGGSETQFRSQGSGSFVGMTSATLNRNEFKLIGEVRDSTEVGHGDKPDYFSVRATVISIKSENIVYPACPTANCNKKVIETDGLWRCEKCNMGHEKPEYRYLVSLCVADHTGQLWFQAFNDVGSHTHELQRLKDEEYSQGSNAFTETVNKASCQMWNFSVRAKMETYGESSRVKYGITKVFRPDFKEEARTLLDAIKQMK